MARKKTKKVRPKNKPNDTVSWVLPLFFAAIAFGLMATLGSWAIDKGQLIGYALAAVAFFKGIGYIKEAVRNLLRK